MAGYKIFFKRSVEKDFAGIPKKDLKRILDRIKTLEKNPRPAGSEKLTGQERVSQGTIPETSGTRYQTAPMASRGALWSDLLSAAEIMSKSRFPGELLIFS